MEKNMLLHMPVRASHDLKETTRLQKLDGSYVSNSTTSISFIVQEGPQQCRRIIKDSGRDNSQEYFYEDSNEEVEEIPWASNNEWNVWDEEEEVLTTYLEQARWGELTQGLELEEKHSINPDLDQS
ncbi:9160_t:CDS:2 [Dentiscutata erythropus]|uniref:9160_t:CDS:1 n=1 Tax=Dentiscutata erythropus TaxID=1348616 RepID=A0A9N9D5Q0_9GLOM|nr:9160_t:CDS:2 [Dentiscutata erythropus]